MYIQKISINNSSGADIDVLVEQFEWLMSYYRGNGQVQGTLQSEYYADNAMISMPFTIEERSLESNLNNFYVSRQIETLKILCGGELVVETLGTTNSVIPTPCICEKSEFYILITNYISIAPPIVCGSCHRSVPLYRLPKYYDHGYMPILNWESNYIACDHLQMNCEVGERWALKQMREIESQLSRQGLAICLQIEELTNIPVYYYLHDYRVNQRKSRLKSCPKCDGQWKIEPALHNVYDFKCDRCRLLSIVSPNS